MSVKPSLHELACQRGWVQSPDGWYWRDIQDGETINNANDRIWIDMFLGSGPFLMAETAADCLIADDVE